jgi:ABC transporter DrrB family efflux protein
MIEVEGVRKSFGTAVALAGVDLSAEAGRVLALLGPNDAGKTTLVRSRSGGTTAVAMGEDMAGGMIERFRSLPRARSAVLAGRTAADTARAALAIVFVLGIGMLLGFRFHNGFLPGLAAFGLILAFSFAISWEMAWLGMTIKDAQAASVGAFVPILIMTFTGGGLVRVHAMPGWLQAFAHVQPLSVTITTVRSLTLGGPIEHTLWQSLAWTVGILAVLHAAHRPPIPQGLTAMGIPIARRDERSSSWLVRQLSHSRRDQNFPSGRCARGVVPGRVHDQSRFDDWRNHE